MTGLPGKTIGTKDSYGPPRAPGSSGEDAPVPRATLRAYPTKTYRLSRETIQQLEGILRANPHTFLSYEELVAELVRFYLARHRMMQGEVERYLRKKSEATQGEGDQADDHETEHPS